MSSRVAVSRRSVRTMLGVALGVAALTAPGTAAAYESSKEQIDPGNSLNAVSCVPASTECVVTDSKGNALYSTNLSAKGLFSWKSWSGPAGTKPSEAVACPSTSLCVLADGATAEEGGNLYYATSLGGAWTEGFEPAFGVNAISCASTSLCVSGQAEGQIRYATNPASKEWEALEIGSGTMNAVDCLTASFCAAVDSKGNVHIANTAAKITEELGWTPTDVDGSTPLDGIACISATSCIAVNDIGNVLHLAIDSSGEATTSIQDLDAPNKLTAITCTGPSCVTVDSRGNIFESANAGATWTKEQETSIEMTSVSCASITLCVAADKTGDVTAFTALAPDNYTLSVHLAGEGKVESNPAGMLCGSEECEGQFAGPVTLTASATTGYVFAGWLGCEHLTAEKCEVDVTAQSEVTAVFLKAGEKGEKGEEGKVGKEGPAGNEGKAGSTGPAGEKGATGAQGPAGPTGAQGPTGKVELVTCTKKGKKQHCTTKLVSGTVNFTTTGSTEHATLSRHGVVYAAGTVGKTHGRISLRLLPVRKLAPGKYMLTLIGGAGKHETIRSESFTLG